MSSAAGGNPVLRCARLFVTVAGALALAFVLAACHKTPVVTFAVTSTADGADANPGDGICEMTAGLADCSLRAAIDEANAFGQAVRAELPAGTYSLTGASGDDANSSGDYDLTGLIEVAGTEAGVIIDGAGVDRVFDLHAGSDLVLEDLTVSGGAVVGDGGGIRMAGQFLTTHSVSLEGNSASGKGGGTALLAGVTSINESTLAANLAGEAGGGAYTAPGATLLAQNSTISGNTVDPDSPSLPATVGGGTPEPLALPAGQIEGSAGTAPLLTPSDAPTPTLPGGRLPVIVELDVDTLPEGALSPPDVASQRAAIADAASELTARAASDPAVRAEVHRTYRTLPYVAMTVAPGGRSALERLDGVRSVHDDDVAAPTLAQSIPWIGADTAQAAGHDGSGTAVTIIDSGVDSSHLMTSPRVVEEGCFAAGPTIGNGTGDCPNGSESQTGAGSGVPCGDLDAGCWHGTHVASIAAGSPVYVPTYDETLIGVAPAADIISINVFSVFSAPACGPGTPKCIGSWDSDQLAAFDYLATLLPTHDVAAVNMSLGGTTFYNSPCDGDPLKSGIDSFRWAGVATIIAAGNGGEDPGGKAGISAPACISTAVSVGATYDTADTVASFSNSGDLLDLLAPGVDIRAAYPGPYVLSADGTSMATPHVTGTFALLHAQDPTASVEELLSVLKTTGVPVTDSANGLTRPRIDVAAALAGLGGSGGGGGLANDGAADLRFTTVTDNSALWGSGVANTDSLTLRATVIASQAAGYDCALDLGATLVLAGYNADSDGSCDLTGDATSLSGVDPDLAALAANGSFPSSHLANAGSPLIDAIAAGTSGLCDGAFPVDQRGITRPTGAGCDVGSTEQ